MNEQAALALSQSIAKWKEKLELAKSGKLEDIQLSHCPLCELYWQNDCLDCPIYEKAGRPSCYDTPFYSVRVALNRKQELPLIQAIEEELEFLSSLED
jgi:hypothetical protein